jgi:tetratricopeptide (TPR) repeat protein
MMLQITLTLIACLIYCSGLVNNQPLESPDNIRTILYELTERGKINDIIKYLEEVQKSYGTLLIDKKLPSLYSFKGVALYNSLETEKAEKTFQLAVKYFPQDSRAWMNLGEIQIQIFKLREAIYSFDMAKKYGEYSAITKLLRTIGWCTMWKDFDQITSEVEKEALVCEKNMELCKLDSNSGLEYTGS